MMDKPIIFSTEMVRAVLEGRKTQTRRVIKPQPASGVRKSVFVKSGLGDGHGREIKIPYQPGDTLWVRETWAKISDWTDVDPEVGCFDGYIYRADWSWEESPKWRPSIHMPREASRISLLVKRIGVERLQDITPYDAWNEGCRIGNSFPWEHHIPELQQQCRDIVFRGLWDSINDKRGFGWETNPFCWVISFEVIKKGC
jgi:hypothetical protein